MNALLKDIEDLKRYRDLPEVFVKYVPFHRLVLLAAFFSGYFLSWSGLPLL
jgi:hypothetical protein